MGIGPAVEGRSSRSGKATSRFARVVTALDDEGRGFTLIELLVVTITIGILAGIVIPTSLNQRKNGWISATPRLSVGLRASLGPSMGCGDAWSGR